ncbi:MAG: RNA pseudouridine synthase [Bdellovibrio sp.]
MATQIIQIVFENDQFVICDKPHGVLSTPARFEDEDRRCLGVELQTMLKMQIYPVHRLDYEVSGLVMYAKSAEAHRLANAWFEKKEIQKTYRAWTTKQDFSHIPDTVFNPRTMINLQKSNKFEWKSKILRGKKRAYESAQGKVSLTLAEFLEANSEGFLQWNLQPVTGRSHQLRFDLSRQGFPILGDKLYGSSVDYGLEKIALRSFKLDFSNCSGAGVLGLPSIIEAFAL